jgi:hypothetical protein
MMKLNIRSFAITCALMWGFGLFFFTWWIMAFDGNTGETILLSKVYRGYNISPIGSVIGLAYGFIDALIGGAIFAWLYNMLTPSKPAASAERTSEAAVKEKQPQERVAAGVD